MLLITCFIFGLLGSLAWAGPQARTVCPSGTFAYKNRNEWNCYKFFEDPLTFQEAEVQCQLRWKGHLASFSSDKQAKSVGAYITQENMEENYVWIGLQRNPGTNMSIGWHWVDGSYFGYRNWGYRVPNGSRGYCAGLSPPSEHLTWKERDCNKELPFLCKWKPR